MPKETNNEQLVLVEHATATTLTSSTDHPLRHRRCISWSLAVILGILFGFVFTTLSPKKVIHQRRETTAISIKPPKADQVAKTCPSSSPLETPAKSTSSSSSSPSYLPPFKSCEKAPYSCIVLYHAFTLPALNSSSRIKDATSSNKPSKYIWRAAISALSLRQTHTLQSKPHPEIVLATNYHRRIISKAKRIFEETIAEQRQACKKSTKKKVMKTPNETTSDPAGFKKLQKIKLLFDSKQSSFLEYFSPLLCSDEEFASYFLRWPFDRVLHPKSPSSFTFRMKADGLDFYHQFSHVIRSKITKRILYVDSDTWVNKPVFEVFDGGAGVHVVDVKSSSSSSSSSSSLPLAVDIGLVQEYDWARGISPYLYDPVLHSEIRSSSPSVFTILPKKASPWFTPHHNAKHATPKKKDLYPFLPNNHATYEVQYNTGIILMDLVSSSDENESSGTSTKHIANFMSLWSQLHRSMPRCENDRVLWDQCSLPMAIRMQKSALSSSSSSSRLARIVTLNDKFNFREALGRGCSDDVYEQDTKVLKEVKMITEGKRVPNFDSVVILHSYEVKERQDEWIKKVFG